MARPDRLARAFSCRTSSGDCPICSVPFEKGDRAFFLATALGSDPAGGYGAPVFEAWAQIETKGKDARHQQRPTGCTCKTSLIHSAKARCPLYRNCSCGAHDPRRHSRACEQRIVWETRAGVFCGTVSYTHLRAHET